MLNYSVAELRSYTTLRTKSEQKANKVLAPNPTLSDTFAIKK